MTKGRLRALVADDSEADTTLLLRELARVGYDVTHTRVDTELGLRDALARESWDVVFSDFAMPGFGGMRALEILRESELDIPAIVLSGTVGEEAAVAVLTAGARDFIVKGHLARLAPALERELHEASIRRAKRAAEASLRTSEERFRTLVASMEDMVFTLDSAQRHTGIFGKWTAWGPATVAQLDGRTLREVVGDEAKVHEDATERALLGAGVVYEWSVSTIGGVRHYQTSLSPIRDPRGEVRGVVGVARETTAQKELQAQLLMADRMSSMGTMAAGVGHEINNPLAVVLANVDLALARLASDAPFDRAELLAELADVREAATRMRSIVSDLKLFSRIDDEHRTTCDVRKIMESSLRMVANEVRHRARLVKHFVAVPPVAVDESRLGQVFVNLLVNAAHALPEGPNHAIEVTISPDETGNVVIAIRDTGTGIAPELFERIFEPFFTTKPRAVGTGLGLSICRRIVTDYGGTIRLESEVGHGALCVVTLPAAEVPDRRTSTPAPRALLEGRRGNIVIVDDDESVARAVQRVLQLDHDVCIFSARELISRACAGETFDAILSDLMMPEIDGVALHEELTVAAPALAERIVYMTGGAFTARGRSFLARVDNERVEKPIDMVRLRTILRRMVR